MKYDMVESDDQIATMSQEKFKNLIKKKVKTQAIKDLYEMTQPHSKKNKSKELWWSEICQMYTDSVVKNCIVMICYNHYIIILCR